jgi:hypothetical protein
MLISCLVLLLDQGCAGTLPKDLGAAKNLLRYSWLSSYQAAGKNGGLQQMPIMPMQRGTGNSVPDWCLLQPTLVACCFIPKQSRRQQRSCLCKQLRGNAQLRCVDWLPQLSAEYNAALL